MRVKQEVLKLKQSDIYSLMLFVLFKLRDIKEYSTISELSYVLDKDNLLNLCEYFGGLTIKIPTILELELVVYSLMLYQYVNVEHKDINEALNLIGNVPNISTQDIKKNYYKICKIMEEYEFNSST